MNKIEHINLTVSDPDSTAALFNEIFDLQIRWSGKSMDNGRTVHIGNPEQGESYLALYTPSKLIENKDQDHKSIANLNHIGIVVADLDEIEQRVQNRGFKTFNHGDYEPGKRFYFLLNDGIEIEVINYK